MTYKQEKAILAIVKSKLNVWPSQTKGFEIVYSRRLENNNNKKYMTFNNNLWGWQNTKEEKRIIDAIFDKNFCMNEEGYIEVSVE